MLEPISPERLTGAVANPEHDRQVRRHFSAEDKRRIVADAEGCTERGQLAARLRRERLYRTKLATWTKGVFLSLYVVLDLYNRDVVALARQITTAEVSSLCPH
jgi:hypothetical protein